MTDRSARVAAALQARGQTAAAERYTAQAQPVASGLQNPDDILSSNRSVAAAKLRAQAEAARQSAANKTGSSAKKYDAIAKESERLAERVERGEFYPDDNTFRYAVWRARYPENSNAELKAKAYIGPERREARQERNNPTPPAPQPTAADQRIRFLASGQSKQATPEQVAAAQQELLRRGEASLKDSVTGKEYTRYGDSFVTVTDKQPERYVIPKGTKYPVQGLMGVEMRELPADLEVSKGVAEKIKTVEYGIVNRRGVPTLTFDTEKPVEGVTANVIQGIANAPPKKPDYFYVKTAEPDKRTGTLIIKDAAARRQEADKQINEFFGAGTEAPGALAPAGRAVFKFGRGALMGTAKGASSILAVTEAAAGETVYRVEAVARGEKLGERNRAIIAATPIVAAEFARGVSTRVRSAEGVGEIVGPIILVKGLAPSPKAPSVAATENLRGTVATRDAFMDLGDGVKVEVTGKPIVGVRVQERSTIVGGIGEKPGTEVAAYTAARDIAPQPGKGSTANPGTVPAGVRTSSLASEPVFGETVTTSPEFLPDSYIVKASVKNTAAVSPRSARPTNLPSQEGGAVTQNVESFAFQATPRQVEKLLPLVGGDRGGSFRPLIRQRITEIDAPTGQINTVTTADLEFIGIPKTVDAPTPPRPVRVTVNPEQLTFKPREIDTTFKAPGQIENLRPYNQEAGDFFQLNRNTGEFGLVRYTESRRFLRGTGEIPGRPTLSYGKLPESAAVQRNLPPELLADFVNTPYGKSLVKPSMRPLLIQKVVIKKPKTPAQTTAETGVGVSSGGQVLILQEPVLEQPKTSTVQTSISETKQESGTLSGETTQTTSVGGTKRSTLKLELDQPAPAGTAIDVAEKPSASVIFASLSRSSSASKTSTAQSSRLSTSQRFDTLRSTGQLSSTSVAVASATDTAQLRDTATAQELLLEQQTRAGLRLRPTETRPVVYPRGERTQDGKSPDLFDVQLKERGQFRTFSTQGMRLEEAVSYAQGIVDTTAKASFRIVDRQTGRPIAGESKTKAERLFTPGRYRPSKVAQDVVVEKNEFRINTPGEKSEIRPGRGIFAKPSKRTFFGGRL